MTDYAGVKEWRKNNKDKVKEQGKRYRKKHPEAEITENYRIRQEIKKLVYDSPELLYDMKCYLEKFNGSIESKS